jgi:hypothetical protein
MPVRQVEASGLVASIGAPVRFPRGDEPAAPSSLRFQQPNLRKAVRHVVGEMRCAHGRS